MLPTLYNRNDEENIMDNSQHNGSIHEDTLNRELNGRRCGYCRCIGHIVLQCNNEEVINAKNELDNIINNNVYTSRIVIETFIDEWLENKSDNLLKAIFCSKKVLKYKYNYTRDRIENLIKNYINNLLYYIRLEQYRNIQNNVANATITILLPYRIIKTKNQLYHCLSIEAKSINPKLNYKDKECPICLDNLTYNTIQKTNCEHEFCKDCLTRTVKGFLNKRNKAKCPLCRSNIDIIYQNNKCKNENIERL